MKKKLKIKIFIILSLILFIFFISLFAPYITTKDPNTTNIALRNKMPTSKNYLGTDNLGRDVFTRLIYGGKACLIISFFVSFTSMIIGLIFGALSGWSNGIIDKIISIFMNIFQGLPGISISISIVGVFGPSNFSIFLALVLSSWSSVARVVRNQVKVIKTKQFIESINIYMPTNLYLLKNHILPIIFPSLFVLTLYRMGRIILSISALSFIGVGLQPPTPDWGVMIQDTRQYFLVQPYSMLAPSFMIFISSYLITYLSEQIRDYLDIYNIE